MRTEVSGPLAFTSVGVVGVGVMGGSLARGLSRLANPPEVVGWGTRRADVDEAAAAGVLSRAAASLEECVAHVDLVILAVPVNAACELMPALASLTGPEALIHDVASLKGPIRNAALSAGLDHRWVGGHPMAGSEASGFQGSRDDLFENARVWLTPGQGTEPRALADVEGLWLSLGAHPKTMEVAEHDRLMAWASHLPQLTANVLALALDGAGIHPSQMGPGGRDTTRLAASSPSMWMEILAHAPPELVEGLRRVAAEAGSLADALEGGDMSTVRAALEASRNWRRDP